MTSRYFIGKTITAGGWIMAILILVVGCTRIPQTGQPGGPAPKVVDIWHSLQGTEADALQGQIQTIMKTHPEGIIKLQYVPEQTFVAFSYQAEAGGEGPEIFIASREIIRQLYEQGLLAKTAYLDQEAFPAALSAFQYGGVGYAAPWLTDVPLLLGSTLGIANSAIKTTEAMTPVIQIVEQALLTPEVEGAMHQTGRASASQ